MDEEQDSQLSTSDEVPQEGEPQEDNDTVDEESTTVDVLQKGRVAEPTIAGLRRFEDVKMTFSVVLGQTLMPLEQFLKLGQGAIFMLDVHKDSQLEGRVNDHPVGRGDITVQEATISFKFDEVYGKKDDDDEMDMAAAMAGMGGDMGDEMDMAAAMAEMDGGGGDMDDEMARAMAEMDG